jgi:hypothetical protein
MTRPLGLGWEYCKECDRTSQLCDPAACEHVKEIAAWKVTDTVGFKVRATLSAAQFAAVFSWHLATAGVAGDGRGVLVAFAAFFACFTWLFWDRRPSAAQYLLMVVVTLLSTWTAAQAAAQAAARARLSTSRCTS